MGVFEMIAGRSGASTTGRHRILHYRGQGYRRQMGSFSFGCNAITPQQLALHGIVHIRTVNDIGEFKSRIGRRSGGLVFLELLASQG